MPNKISLKTNFENSKVADKTILDNGVRVLSKNIPSIKSVSLGFWIETGSQNETSANNGISHFIEHMVFKGTKKRSLFEISHSLESLGGYLNAFTSKEHTCYYARFLNSHLPIAFDVLADLYLNPNFDTKEIEKEKGVVIEELKNMEDDPGDLIHDYFDKVMYPSHPVGMSIIGTKDSINNFTQKELFNYKKRNYKSSNLVITAAGNLEHKNLVNLVEKYFSKYSNGSESNNISKIFNYQPQNKNYEKPIQQTHLIYGRTIFPAISEKRWSGYILNTLLGSGMSSRLFQKIREKSGLAYTVYSFLNCMKATGTFGVYLACDSLQSQKAMDLVKKEFNSILKNGITKTEVKRAKEHLKGSTVLQLESASNQMMRLGTSEFYYKKQFPVEVLLSKIDEIKIEEIMELAQEILDINKFSEVKINPKIN